MANYYTVYVKPSCLWTDETLIDKRIDAHFYSIKYMRYYNKLMKCKIKKMSLYNICSRMNSGPFGSALLASQYVDKGIAFVRPLNCKDYIVDINNDVVFISKEDSERLKSSKFSLGDLIFTKIGNGIGDVAIIPQKTFECNISGNLMGVKIKNNIDNYYVLTFLKSIYGQNQIWQGMMNSAKPKIDMDTLKSIEIPIPSPEIQKYIGDKVRKAEELREEAKRLKKEAEEIIYKELNISVLENKFKDLNNKYTWVDPTNLENRVDSKYYDEKVLKIKNYFNKHYYTLKLKDCLQYCARGKSFAQNCEEGIILIKTKNLNNSIISYEENFVCEKEVNNNLILKEKDLLFASMGVGSLGKIDMYYPIKEKSTIDGTLTLLRFRNDCKLKPEYVMEFIRTQIGQKLVYQNVVGSTGIISISVEDLINIDIPFIEIEKQEKISKNVGKYLANFYTSKQLIQEAKQDVEDLIEGNFDMSKVKANN